MHEAVRRLCALAMAAVLLLAGGAVPPPVRAVIAEAPAEVGAEADELIEAMCWFPTSQELAYDALWHGPDLGGCQDPRTGLTPDGLTVDLVKDVPGGLVHWSLDGRGVYTDQQGDIDVRIHPVDPSCTVRGFDGPYDGRAHGATGGCTGIGGEAAGWFEAPTTYRDVPGGSVPWTFQGNGNYTDRSGSVQVTIRPATASCTVVGYAGTYDGAAHGASGACHDIAGQLMGGLDLGASFTNVPGGRAHWTLAADSNYATQDGYVDIIIDPADASCVVTGFTGPYDGRPHGASGTCTGLGGSTLAGLNLGSQFVGPGTFTANWSFGATNYAPESGSVAITITAPPTTDQSITFTSTAPTGASVAGATYSPAATATSGLPVAFTIDPAAAAVCSISAGVVSFTGVGTCIVNANQAGNATWNPAPQVQQSFAVGPRLPGILYAVPGGATSGHCTTWGTACELRYALAQSVAGDEIWAAMGSYLPTASTDRTATFRLRTGVGLYGGFVGTETTRAARDWTANVTSLSGDIGVAGDTSDNAYHVVTGSGTDGTAILEGFTVRLGHGSGPSPDGGGMLNNAGSPTVRHVTFTGNLADYRGGGMFNEGANPTLSDVTFSGNSAQWGGGMDNVGSSPSLTDVRFTGNGAKWGGGMDNWSSSPTLTRVTFSGNWSTDESNTYHYGDRGGGGMQNRSASNPVLTDVTFAGNSAYNGGGIFNHSSSPTLTSVTFTGNAGTYMGGAAMDYASSPTLTNVTMTDNVASYGGGLAARYGSNPTLRHVTSAGNRLDLSAGGGSALYSDHGSQPVVVNSILWGGVCFYSAGLTATSTAIEGGCPSSATCTDVTGLDPLLGAVGDHGGATRTIPLLPGSAAIDSATGDGCPATDQRGVSRPRGDRCDMGAFEARAFALDRVSGDGQRAALGGVFADPLVVAVTGTGSDPVAGGRVSFAGPTSGASASFATGGARIGDDGRASATATANDVVGAYEVDATVAGATNAVTFDLQNVAGILYARPDGLTSGACDSWEQACTLAYALGDAPRPSGARVWVAAGIHVPDATGLADPRTATFALGSRLRVYGGFQVGDDFDARDPATKLTTLSGDLGDGVRAYHVVTAAGADATTVLDGFTITAGDANGTSPDDRGGGLLNTSGSPVLRNLAFTGNAATTGGGLANAGGSPTLTDVTFDGNAATTGGGMATTSGSPVLTRVTFSENDAVTGAGLSSDASSPRLTEVTFSDNVATGGGGGMATGSGGSPTLDTVTFTGNFGGMAGGGGMLNHGTSPTVTDATFTSNGSSGAGAGMHNTAGSSPSVTRASFVDNRTRARGGGMANTAESRPTLRDVTFKGNGGGRLGGGLYVETSTTSFSLLRNVTFEGNSAGAGGAIYAQDYRTLVLRNVTFTGNWGLVRGGGMYNVDSALNLTYVTFSGNTSELGGAMYNEGETGASVVASILWGDTGGEIVNDAASTVAVQNSDVQGGYPGGNLNADPLLGTLGDHGGFTHTIPLLPGSPAIDGLYAVWMPGINRYMGCYTLVSADQRDVPREREMPCDMGAYQSRPFTLSRTSGSGQDAYVGSAFGDPLVVTVGSEFGDPVAGGRVTFDAWAAGATFVPAGDATAEPSSPALIPIAPDGTASATAIATSVVGFYDVWAGARGTPAVTFRLTNLPKIAPAFTFDLAGLPSARYGEAAFSVAGNAGKPSDDTGAITFGVADGSTGCEVTSEGLVTLTAATSGDERCTITASLAGDGKYLPGEPISQGFAIAKAVLTVSADALTMTYGGAVPAIGVSYDGFVNGETLATSGVTGEPACTIAAGPYTVAGNPYAIDCEQGTLGAGNYAFDIVDGALTVQPAVPAFGFDLAALPAKTYGDATFGVAGYATKPADDTGTITFVLGAESAGCSVTETGEVTITGATVDAGECVIKASLAADDNYLAAGPIAQAFEIAKAKQAPLSITGPASIVYGEADAKIVTSGGTTAGGVTFDAGSSTACSIVAGKLHGVIPTASGATCSMTATMAGNANYEPVTSAAFDVTVRKAPATVVYTGPTYRLLPAGTTTTGVTLSASVSPAFCAAELGFTVTSGLTNTAVTGSGAAYTLETGLYWIVATVDGTYCTGGLDDATIAIVSASDKANGGGWYKVDTIQTGSPRVNLGYTVQTSATTDKKTGTVTTTYRGQLLWLNNGQWRLKGTVYGQTALTGGVVSGTAPYGTFACPTAFVSTLPAGSTEYRCGSLTGSGTLQAWDAETLSWVDSPEYGSVTFTATMYDGGQAKVCKVTSKKTTCSTVDNPDWFGIQFDSVPSNVIRESTPVVLVGGSIKVG